MGAVRQEPPSHEPLNGRVLDGRYELLERIGAGGMGVVYRGMQPSVERQVAVKVIGAAGATDDAVTRFLDEALLASRLAHPNIVVVFDRGQTKDGLLYIVMELLRGRTLAEALADRGAWTPERAIAIGVQLCNALEAAHGAGVLHRDLKPLNVMLVPQPDGQELVKVLDFGLATAHSGDRPAKPETSVLGTPMYMAPEALIGEALDERSDLFALGVVIYSMVSGRPPNAVPTNAVTALVLERIQHTFEPLDDSVPAPLRNVIHRLLSGDRADRFRSAAATREALLAAGEALRAAGEGWRPLEGDGRRDTVLDPTVKVARSGRLRSAQRRRAAIVAAAVVVAVALLGGVAALTVGSSSGEAPAVGPTALSPQGEAGPAGRTATPPEPLPAPPPPPTSSAETVSLSVTSTPSGAVVTLDGVVVGRTPLAMNVAADERLATLGVSHRGYKTVTRKLRLDRSADIKTKLPPQKGARKEEFIAP